MSVHFAFNFIDQGLRILIFLWQVFIKLFFCLPFAFRRERKIYIRSACVQQYTCTACSAKAVRDAFLFSVINSITLAASNKESLLSTTQQKIGLVWRGCALNIRVICGKERGSLRGGGGDQGPFDSVSLELEGREAYYVSPPPPTRLPREQHEGGRKKHKIPPYQGEACFGVIKMGGNEICFFFTFWLCIHRWCGY